MYFSSTEKGGAKTNIWPPSVFKLNTIGCSEVLWLQLGNNGYDGAKTIICY
jgi:hypothetical protein